MQKEIQVNRTGTKKLFGTYIYKVFTEESSDDNRFSVRQLQARIKERFEQAIERSTLHKHINALKANPNFNIEGDETGYFFPKEIGPLYIKEEDRLDDIEITLLVDMVRKSKRLTYDERNALKEKLINQCVDNTTIGYLLSKDIVHKEKSTKNQYLQDRLLFDLPIILENQRPMMIKLKRTYIEPYIEAKYKKFFPYAVVPMHESYMLFGRDEKSEIAKLIDTNMIEDYKYLEDETFEKFKIDLYPPMFLREENLEILKAENKDDFIFHTKEETIKRRNEQRIQRTENKV